MRLPAIDFLRIPAQSDPVDRFHAARGQDAVDPKGTAEQKQYCVEDAHCLWLNSGADLLSRAAARQGANHL